MSLNSEWLKSRAARRFLQVAVVAGTTGSFLLADCIYKAMNPKEPEHNKWTISFDPDQMKQGLREYQSIVETIQQTAKKGNDHGTIEMPVGKTGTWTYSGKGLIAISYDDGGPTVEQIDPMPDGGMKIIVDSTDDNKTYQSHEYTQINAAGQVVLQTDHENGVTAADKEHGLKQKTYIGNQTILLVEGNKYDVRKVESYTTVDGTDSSDTHMVESMNGSVLSGSIDETINGHREIFRAKPGNLEAFRWERQTGATQLVELLQDMGPKIEKLSHFGRS